MTHRFFLEGPFWPQKGGFKFTPLKSEGQRSAFNQGVKSGAFFLVIGVISMVAEVRPNAGF